MASNHLYSLLGSDHRFLRTPLPSATYSLLPGLWVDLHRLDDWHASHTRASEARCEYIPIRSPSASMLMEGLRCTHSPQDALAFVRPQMEIERGKPLIRFDGNWRWMELVKPCCRKLKSRLNSRAVFCSGVVGVLAFARPRLEASACI